MQRRVLPLVFILFALSISLVFAEGSAERPAPSSSIIEKAEAAAERAEEAASRAEAAADAVEGDGEAMFVMGDDQFLPTWESIKKHETPEWFEDAKLGIMICWGPYSVPAFAPPSGELGEFDFSRWFIENPYAEWYANTYKIDGSPTYEYHMENYGPDVDYSDIVDMWKAENWDPNEWAELFSDIGVRYTVLVARHIDSFALWPSDVEHPVYGGSFSTKTLGPKRDLAGELADAMRAKDIKPGLYYCNGQDLSFEPAPVTTWAELSVYRPQTSDYYDYVFRQIREMVDRYKPEVLWGDMGWPIKETEYLTKYILANYYNTVPNGVVNDRLTDKFNDFTTAEYQVNQEAAIAPHKWELTRGIGFSFGYNAAETEEHHMTVDALVQTLVDVVSKNGNLLLDVGPKADGTIPQLQKERLIGLGKWLDTNGEAIFATRPWTQFRTETSDGIEVRFTKEKHDKAVYAVLFDKPGKSFVLKETELPRNAKVELLGSNISVSAKKRGSDMLFTTESEIPFQSEAYVFKVSMP